jgi:hypothetical protein
LWPTRWIPTPLQNTWKMQTENTASPCFSNPTDHPRHHI